MRDIVLTCSAGTGLTTEVTAQYLLHFPHSFPPDHLGFGHCNEPPRTEQIFHKHEISSSASYVERDRRTVLDSFAVIIHSAAFSLKKKSNVTLELLVNVPFQDTKYFKRNKIEILVSVCSRHHGTFEHNRRQNRLVLHQELIHIVDVVTV